MLADFNNQYATVFHRGKEPNVTMRSTLPARNKADKMSRCTPACRITRRCWEHNRFGASIRSRQEAVRAAKFLRAGGTGINMKPGNEKPRPSIRRTPWHPRLFQSSGQLYKRPCQKGDIREYDECEKEHFPQKYLDITNRP